MHDQILQRTLELARVQIGSQVLTLCEATAKAQILEEHLAAVTKERDDLKAQKAGVSAT